MAKQQQTNSVGSVVSGALSAFGSVTLSTVIGWILYSRFFINHNVALPPAIPADQERFKSEKAGFLSYYVDRRGTGRPLVLIHSINAAASAYEMRPIFEHYRGTRPVYALDLPGFGFSERANRVYTPQLFTDAIIDFMTEKVGAPADVIALSLGSEFAARAALQKPALFNTLALISPSGFADRKMERGSQEISGSVFSNIAYRLFTFPLWSQAFYDLLATRRSIHYFLKQSFEGQVDAGLAAWDYATTHQPGARNAPFYFVSGKLFDRHIRQNVYEKLTLPVLVIHDLDAFVRFDTLPDVVARHQNWRVAKVVPTRGLPQFEKIAETAAALEHFWTQSVSAQDAMQYLNQ
jgi:pimeloyl-ACP methyl ester carboxylesterase